MRNALKSSEVEAFRTLICERLGLHFDEGRLDFLADILRQRMERSGCDQVSRYLGILTGSSSERQELRKLATQLTIGETSFFRNIAHFDALIDVVIPDRMRAQAPRRQLRILSAGCASGEEAYTVAILLREHFPDLASWDVTIRGIDINPLMIEKALRARYSAWSIRETSNELRTRYFRTENREFLLKDCVRAAASFEEKNLVEDDPLFWQPGSFDVVFCRNVLMYFAPEVTRTVIARITRSLTPGGFLFLGHAETLRGISHDFHLRHTHNTFYYQEKEDAPSAPGEVRQGSNSHKDSWFTAIQQATDRVISLTHTKSEVSSHLSADFCPTPPQWDPLSTMELLQQERYAEALQAMMDLPAGVKDDPNVQLLRAVLLTNSGNLVEAEKVCHRLFELDELNAGAHYLMALCREHNGALHAAIEHNQAAVYLDPTFAMPHLHLGLMAERMGDVNGAVKEFVQARELLPAEDSNRILLFGGGFTREALMKFCHAKQQSNGDRA